MESNVDIVIEIHYYHTHLNFACVSCGYNVIKQKHELTKIQGKKINFINRLKYAEHKIFYICVDVYKIYGGDNFDKTYEILSTLKNKK